MTATTPRPGDTITTAEQLAALPVGSRIRDSFDISLERLTEGWAVIRDNARGGARLMSSRYTTAQVLEGGDGRPFTVLFMSDVPAAPPAEDTPTDVIDQAARAFAYDFYPTREWEALPEVTQQRCLSAARAAASLLAAAPSSATTTDAEVQAQALEAAADDIRTPGMPVRDPRTWLRNRAAAIREESAR